MNQVQGGEPTKTGGKTRRGHSRVQRKKGTRRKGKNEDVGNSGTPRGRTEQWAFFHKAGRAGAGRGRRGGAKGPTRGAPRLGTGKTTDGGQGEEEEEGFWKPFFWGGGNRSKGRRGCLVLYY